MRLDRFDNRSFDRGRHWLIEALWIVLQGLLVDSWLPGSAHRIILLRFFGARIGKGVVIKPHVRVKFPWRLKVGDHSWIGENAWIDNLADVTIGSHCCLSQDVYLCTGSHNWSSETFDLMTAPIVLEEEVWLCARSSVGPGVTIGRGAVITLGSIAISDMAGGQIYGGIPAVAIRDRVNSRAQVKTGGEARRA